jgi:steroid 5-alpha reductase family enzyme
MQPQHHVAISLATAALVQGAALLAEQAAPRSMEAAAGASAALTAASTLVARGTFFPRQLACTALMVAGGARLSWHLARRQVESRLSARQLCVSRTLWSAAVALPVVAANTLQAEPVPPGACALGGAALAAAGLALETLADAQKAAWHAARAAGGRPPPESAEPPVCAEGAWAWSRHPNYFAEIAFHVGLYMLVAAVVPPVTAASPLATCATLALLHTGPLRTLEREKAALFGGHPAYLRYLHRTSPLVPLPPGAFAACAAACPRLCAAEACL